MPSRLATIRKNAFSERSLCIFAAKRGSRGHAEQAVGLPREARDARLLEAEVREEARAVLLLLELRDLGLDLHSFSNRVELQIFPHIDFRSPLQNSGIILIRVIKKIAMSQRNLRGVIEILLDLADLPADNDNPGAFFLSSGAHCRDLPIPVSRADLFFGSSVPVACLSFSAASFTAALFGYPNRSK